MAHGDEDDNEHDDCKEAAQGFPKGFPPMTYPTYPLFRSRDFYLAAYLHLLNVPLVATTYANGRVEFAFDNANERAYHAFLDFQADNGNDLVPLKQFRAAYRSIQNAARRAKEAASYDDYNDDSNI